MIIYLFFWYWINRSILVVAVHKWFNISILLLLFIVLVICYYESNKPLILNLSWSVHWIIYWMWLFIAVDIIEWWCVLLFIFILEWSFITIGYDASHIILLFRLLFISDLPFILLFLLYLFQFYFYLFLYRFIANYFIFILFVQGLLLIIIYIHSSYFYLFIMICYYYGLLFSGFHDDYAINIVFWEVVN